MSSPSVEQITAAPESILSDSTLVHILCCRKRPGDQAFCGLPVTREVTSVTGWCVVCADISQGASRDRCPQDGGPCTGEGEW